MEPETQAEEQLFANISECRSAEAIYATVAKTFVADWIKHHGPPKSEDDLKAFCQQLMRQFFFSQMRSFQQVGLEKTWKRTFLMCRGSNGAKVSLAEEKKEN